MKKILLSVICLVAMTTMATAQERPVLGVRAGLNVSSMTMKLGNTITESDARVGYHVGLSYQVPLVSKLFLETGLNLSTRGMRMTEKDINDEGIARESKMKLNMLYLQLPIAFSWHIDISSFSLQPFVGVYYEYGLHGKSKVSDESEKINVFQDTDLGDGDLVPQLLKRSDFGLRMGVGATFNKKYYLGVGYDFGLLNIIKDKEDAAVDKIRNGNLFISAGYNF